MKTNARNATKTVIFATLTNASNANQVSLEKEANASTTAASVTSPTTTNALPALTKTAIHATLPTFALSAKSTLSFSQRLQSVKTSARAVGSETTKQANARLVPTTALLATKRSAQNAKPDTLCLETNALLTAPRK